MSFIDWLMFRDYADAKSVREVENAYWSRMIVFILFAVIVVGGIVTVWQWLMGTL